MQRLEPALLLSALPHGETAVIARVLSADQGVVAAYVHGGRGRRLRPVLQTGNRLALDLADGGGQRLPVAGVHLLAANLAMLHGPAAIEMVGHVCGLLAALLPEAVAQPRLFAMADALLAGAGAGAAGPVLGAALVRLELALLAELGLGLDLARCAATGARTDLAYVSPRSRQAVARGPGAPWASRLLPLPAFLISDAPAAAADVADGLRLSGHFLARDALAGTRGRDGLLAARARAVALLAGA